MIGLAAERFTKNLWSERASAAAPAAGHRRATRPTQARYVVERVLENREAGIALKSQAVLFRASHHAAPLEIELTRRNIPFVKFGGLKFLDAAHVKDVLALPALRRESARPRRRLPRRCSLLPGIGPATAARVLDALAGAPIAARRWPASRRRRARPTTGRRSPSCSRSCSRRGAGWPAELEQVRPLVRAASRAHPRGRRRCAPPISTQLEQIAAGYPTRERFLTELTLDPPDATSDEAGAPLLDEDYLILSTIHSAKGQEWKSVFVLNAVDGCIPSDLATGTTDEIEEERRLLYVAMTRAKDQLDLIVPQRFYTHQPGAQRRPPRLRQPHALHSGFDVVRHFDRRIWPAARTETPANRAPGADADRCRRPHARDVETGVITFFAPIHRPSVRPREAGTQECLRPSAVRSWGPACAGTNGEDRVAPRRNVCDNRYRACP